MDLEKDFQKRRRSGPTYFDVGNVGRKTGIKLPTNIAKNADGFDDLEDFFEKAQLPEPKLKVIKEKVTPAKKNPLTEKNLNIEVNAAESSYSEYSEYSNIFENVEENHENYNPNLKKLQQMSSREDNYMDFKVPADSGSSTPRRKSIISQIPAFGSTPMRGDFSVPNQNNLQTDCDVSQIEENIEMLANVSIKPRDSFYNQPQSRIQSTRASQNFSSSNLYESNYKGSNNTSQAYNHMGDDNNGGFNNEEMDFGGMDYNDDNDNHNEDSFTDKYDAGSPMRRQSTATVAAANTYEIPMDSEVAVNRRRLSKTMIKIDPTSVTNWISPLKGSDMVAKESKKKVVYVDSDEGDTDESAEDSDDEMDETFVACDIEAASNDENDWSVYVDVDEECDQSILASQNLDESSNQLPIALRKSTRTRLEPLKYWENEKVVLDKRKSGGYLIKDVIRGDNVDKKLRTKKKKTNLSEELREAGFRGKPFVRVKKNAIDEHLEEIVKVPSMMNDIEVDVNDHTNTNYNDEKLQGSRITPGFETNSFSSGVLFLPPLTIKSDVKTGTSSMVFHILSGSIVVKVHNTTFKLKNGSHFYVPPGNSYELRNETKSKVKLLFTQVKN